ncbi:MAG TPA: PC4/YdbC family ssDNA-binding protein [Clostridia bacterium]|nr:PC4/YdbC family ssDNA-binding protein [Clostridia bacterium]
MPDITYEVKEEIGVISEAQTGWTRQVNMISWNKREPKLDIRDWAPEREKAGKGITLTKEEVIKLRDYLNGLNLD